MKKIWNCILFVLFVQGVSAQTDTLLFKTNFGNFKVMLYDFTPNHRALILNAVNNNVYHKALFNRVIDNFVVQGGAHDHAIAEREKNIDKTQRYRLKPEFNQLAFHKLGALGAGRDDNEDKSSFLDQIYFVVGKQVTQTDLDLLEQNKKYTFTPQQKQTYLNRGGLPRLDGDYTVFGEVFEGLDVLLKISKLKTDAKDAPINDVIFEIEKL